MKFSIFVAFVRWKRTVFLQEISEMAIPVAPQPVQQPKSWGEYLKKLKNNTCSDGCCSLRVEQATIDKKFNSVYYIAQCNKRCQILYLCHLFHVLNSLCFYSAFKTLRPNMRAFWWMCVYSRNLCKLTKPTRLLILAAISFWKITSVFHQHGVTLSTCQNSFHYYV